jgi:hypothetical protein
MKKLIFILLLLIPFFNSIPQEIGELAPDKKPEEFPDNALGIDIMFSEGGVGLGTFYRREISRKITLFGDLSISESKDDQEFDYYDIFGRPIPVFGKKNRVFLVPLNLGLQYRLFEGILYDNLRPYLNLGAGPSIVFTTPYDKEYFDAFSKAHANYAVGGYAGFGANFGLDKSSLIGINLRYYIIHLFDEGVETLYQKHRKDLGGIFLTLNFGFMY